ncbi:MAG: tetratricopeptide repeat protein [Flammeovirgaceae bacterium]|nr:tetratricopeptide repeat protein [Flammeovirgaceae bacterium]
MAKKEEKKDILENPEVLQDTLMGAENWVEKNPKTIIGIAGVLLLIVGGYFGFNYYKQSQNAEAQKQMYQAIYYFEADSLSLALNGDGNNLGFIDIIEEFGVSDAANLANYYAGVCFLKQSKFDAAILYLSDFSSNDLLVQARAYSLIGDANMELAKYDEAATYYNKAANYKPNKYFSPSYLMKAALAYEKLNDNERAKEAYQKIIDEYFDSSEYQNARKLKARLESNS